MRILTYYEKRRTLSKFVFFLLIFIFLSDCSDISPAERFSVGFCFYSIKYIIYPNNPYSFCGLRKPIQECFDVRSEQIPVHADHTVIFAVEFYESISERGYVFFRCRVAAD